MSGLYLPTEIDGNTLRKTEILIIGKFYEINDNENRKKNEKLKIFDKEEYLMMVKGMVAESNNLFKVSSFKKGFEEAERNFLIAGIGMPFMPFWRIYMLALISYGDKSCGKEFLISFYE
jgi:hypothetical protein